MQCNTLQYNAMQCNSLLSKAMQCAICTVMHSCRDFECLFNSIVLWRLSYVVSAQLVICRVLWHASHTSWAPSCIRLPTYKYPSTGATHIWVAPHELGYLALHIPGAYLRQHIWYSSSWSTVYLNGSLAHLGIWRQNILPGGALLCTWVPYLGSTIRAGRKSPSLGNSSWADSQDSFLCIAPDITPSVSYKIKSNTLKTLIYDVGPSRKIHNFTLVRLVDLVAVWL